jgi:hypothetical protein
MIITRVDKEGGVGMKIVAENRFGKDTGKQDGPGTDGKSRSGLLSGRAKIASLAALGAYFLSASPEHIINLSAPIPTAFTIRI